MVGFGLAWVELGCVLGVLPALWSCFMKGSLTGTAVVRTLIES